MTGCRRVRISQRGFTLIEILVVLIVVGMLAALTIANMAGGSRQRELREQVREVYLLMQTASEQAVLNNRELGLMLEKRGYRFVAFEEETGEWSPSSEQIFRFRSFPDWLLITAHLGNDTPRLASAREDSPRPDVVFFSSGETTPFELEFTLVGNADTLHSITSDGISPLHWNRPGAEDWQ